MIAIKTATFAVALVFALPAIASAEWTMDGAPLAEDSTLQLSGGNRVDDELGQWTCRTMSFELKLTAGSETGHVVGFDVEEEECTVVGLLPVICGKPTLSEVEKVGDWIVRSVQGELLVPNAELLVQFGDCLEYLTRGQFRMSLSEPGAIAVAFSEGNFTHDGLGYGSEMAAMLLATPRGTFGVK